jgi:hypothetical protein
VVVTALSVAAVAYAANSTTGDQIMKVSPSKLSKKSFKNVKLTTETTFLNNSDPGSPSNPTLIPATASDVKLKFDDDIKFTTKGLPQCTKSLEQTTTQQALAKCGKAKVGSGHVTACVVGTVGNPCFQVQGDITAFNGKPKGKNPTLILHVRTAPPIVATVILTGTLKKGGSGDFGSTLDVPVPYQTLPTATTDFTVAISKKYTVKGKKQSYVSARCADKNKELNLQTTIEYNPTQNEDTDHASSFQKCST